MNNAYLAHHGILGMKWGVRRSEAQLARARGHSSKPSDDKNEVAARKVAVKNRRTMSDSDLKKRIERLKLEREFKNLTEDDIAPGRKYVSEILSASGKKALTMAAAGAMTYEETLPHRHRDYWQMPCSLGADLSQGDDFCAFTFLFPLSNGSFGIKTRNYISSSTLMKLPAAMRIKYDQFMKEGSLIVLEGTVLDMMEVYEDLDNHIIECGYDVRCFGYDPYNAKEFVERWASENGPFGIEKVIQGAKTESVPLGELKKLSEERMLLFDEDLMTFAMGNCITLEDTNGNRKLLKKRYEQKIDAVAAMMDAYIAYKANREAFE